MSEQNTAVQEREQQTAQKTVRFEILRQDTAESNPYWENFEVRI